MRKKKKLFSKQIKKSDKSLLVLILVFIFLGLIAVADVSAPQAMSQFNDKFFFLKQQSAWALFGLILMFLISKIDYKIWQKFATTFFFLTLILLIAVLIPGIGSKLLGARRWISIGSFNLQPSEIVKLSLSMYLAKVSQSKKGAISYFLPFILVLLLIMLQPDLGTALIMAGIGLSQIFVSGVSMIYFFGSFIIGLLSTLILIIFSPYRRDRLTTFLKMTSDPLGRDYHIRQILLSLGSGGLFGVGVGQSRQKYLFLPEATTDSIFAVILEEIGFFGGIVIIGLFVYFIIRVFKIALNAPDDFSRVLSVGIAGWLGGQIFLNIASMAALVPLTGVPLPFFSYGGSSLVTVLIACGILLNISSNEVKR